MNAGAITSVVAGVLVLVIFAFEGVVEQVWLLLPVAAILLVLSFWATRRLISGKASGAATAGLWLLTLGGVVLAVLGTLGAFAELVLGKDPDQVFPSWMEAGFPVGGIALALGLLVFGVAAILSGLPKAPFLLMLLFLPVGLGIDAMTGALQSDDTGVGFYLGFGMLSAGLIWLGLFLRSQGPASPSAPSGV